MDKRVMVVGVCIALLLVMLLFDVHQNRLPVFTQPQFNNYFYYTFAISNVSTNTHATVLSVNNESYQMQQLPNKFTFEQGSRNFFIFSNTIQGYNGIVYTFNRTSGCGIIGIASVFYSTRNCTITAYYKATK